MNRGRPWIRTIGYSPTPVLIMVMACGPGPLPPPVFGDQVSAVCPPEGSDKIFSPPDDIQTHGLPVDFLKAGGFTPLWCSGDSSETYRMIWMPSFRATVIGLATKTASGWNASAVEFADARDGSRGRANVMAIAHRYSAQVTGQSGSQLPAAIEKARFWSTPRAHIDGMAVDGYGWAIEGRSGTRYRLVTRINAHDEPFEEAARVLLRLSGMRIPIEMEPAETVRKLQNQVPPWPTLTHNMAWIFAGDLAADGTWADQINHVIRWRSTKTDSMLPIPGDVLQMNRPVDLRIVEFGGTGESRRAEAPVGRRSSPEDVIVGVPVSVNFLIEVRQVVVEPVANGRRGVWIQVVPRE